jgi:hypothetical protein
MEKNNILEVPIPGFSQPLIIKSKDYLSNEASIESEMKECIYGVESITIDKNSFEADVKYSIEKFFGNKNDSGAPKPGKGVLYLGSEDFNYNTVNFLDGSTAKFDVNSIFNSSYVKNLAKEYNEYYAKKGYKPFTEKDKSSIKLDSAQVLRKLYSNTTRYKLDINFFNNAAIYGIFSSQDLKKITDHYEIPDGSVKKNSENRSFTPYCIVYTTPENKVFVKRFLYIAIQIKGRKANKYGVRLGRHESRNGSGGKEIGTVQ